MIEYFELLILHEEKASLTFGYVQGYYDKTAYLQRALREQKKND